MAQFESQIWIADVQTALQGESVYRGIAEKPYEGVLAVGNAVTVPTLSVGAFTSIATTNMIDWSTATTSGVQVNIDQKKVLSVILPDVVAAQSNANMYEAATKAIASKIVDEIEPAIAGLYTGAGITDDLGDDTTPLEVNSKNALDFLNLVSEKLSEAKTPKFGRWVVVPSNLGGRIRKALGNVYTDNAALMAGAICEYDGLMIYESPYCKNTSGAKYKVMAGGFDSIAYIGNLERMDHIPRTNGVFYGEGISAVLIYGKGVTRADALACATVNVVSEASSFSRLLKKERVEVYYKNNNTIWWVLCEDRKSSRMMCFHT